MSTAPKSKWSSGDWSTIISGVGQGAGEALGGMSGKANSAAEAKEAKRRMLAKLMQNAMKRNAALFQTGQDYSESNNDFQNQALQQIARGFSGALQGSTRRG